MRLRNAALCAASALALALAVPGSAAVADGELRRATRIAAERGAAVSTVLAAGSAVAYANSHEARDNWSIG